MTITVREIKDYCRPFLSRRTFKFRKLKPLLGGSKVKKLMLAKAFANPGKDSSNFQAELDRAHPDIYDPIAEEFAKLNAKASVSHQDRFETSENVRRIFLEHGIFTDFGRPGSVGLIINQTSIQGIPTYFVLGESLRQTVFSGRLYPPRGDDPGALMIQVSSAASRVAELLDIMFNNNGSAHEHLEKNLVRVSKQTLRGWASQLDFEREEVPVRLILLAVSMRASVESLLDILSSSPSPQEFLRTAVNLQLDSIVAHETSHIEERKANGHIPLNKETKEILAYLLEAVYGRPDLAFRTLMHRDCDLGVVVPKLVDHIRDKGSSAFLMEAESLRPFALEALDDSFLSIAGKKHSAVISGDEIKNVQSSDYVEKECMPLIERAMCNPSLQGGYKPRED